MQQIIDKVETIIEKVGDVAEVKVELWKLKATDKIAQATSSIIAIAAIVVFLVTSVTILSFGVAFWVGQQLNNYGYGFFIVGGFYALFGLVLFFFRNKWIKHPLRDIIIDEIIK